MDNLDDLDAEKEVYLQHRMASTSVAWPDGFNYGVSRDRLGTNGVVLFEEYSVLV